MKVQFLILSATLLSAPALAQQTKDTTLAPAVPPPVVKKRTPSLTMEGTGQVFKSAADQERDDRWTAILDGMKEFNVQLDSDEQRTAEDNVEARRLMDSRLVHRRPIRRASPFRLRH